MADLDATSAFGTVQHPALRRSIIRSMVDQVYGHRPPSHYPHSMLHGVGLSAVRTELRSASVKWRPVLVFRHRSTRAKHAQAAPDIHVRQPGTKDRTQREAHGPSQAGPRPEECTRAVRSRQSPSAIATICHDLPCHVTVWSFWVAISAPRVHSPTKKRPGGVVHDPNPTRIQGTLRGKFCWGEIQNADVGCALL